MSSFSALMGLILFCSKKPCDFVNTFMAPDGTYIMTVCNDQWRSAGFNGTEYILYHWHTKDRKYGHKLVVTQTNCRIT